MKAALLILLLAITATVLAKDIRALVWDEQQPQQKEAYGKISSARPSPRI